MEIDQNFMARIVLYFYNYSESEQLTNEDFNEAYGSVMGNHYWSKWSNLYHRDFFKMIGYFGYKSDDGQIFCNLVAKMIERYEERIGRKM